MWSNTRSSSQTNNYDNRSIADGDGNIAAGGASASSFLAKYMSGNKQMPGKPSRWPAAVAVVCVAALVVFRPKILKGFKKMFRRRK